MTFQEIGLHQDLLKAISDLGFENPTPIQKDAIPFLIKEKTDLIGLAQTGTGKTAAFSLPILHQIDYENATPQCLILCPTRELCLQIAKDLKKYTKYLKQAKTVAVYGGTPPYTQKKALKNGVHIVVGTPGRTLDLIRQKALKIEKIKWLVLDEADEMLNMGFQQDLESILKNTPDSRQTLLFSATMSPPIEKITHRYMKEPHKIKVARQNIGSRNIEHHFYMTKASHRFDTLQRIVDAHPDIYGIIFCRTRVETQKIANKMISLGYNADCLHGDLGQAQRDKVMDAFKEKSIQLLIATDVASRGIDVEELTHVINYQLPDDPEIYVHRSGRTGRAGNKGVSICIIHSKEGRKLGAIEKMVGKEFVRQSIPDGHEIVEKQFEHFLDELKSYEPDKNLIDEHFEIIQSKIGDLHAETIVNRLFSLQLHRFIESYEKAPDLNITAELSSHKQPQKKRLNKSSKWKNYIIKLGSKDKMTPKKLISMINNKTDSNNIPIGDISISKKETYFDVDPTFAKQLEKAFQGTNLLFFSKKKNNNNKGFRRKNNRSKRNNKSRK